MMGLCLVGLTAYGLFRYPQRRGSTDKPYFVGWIGMSSELSPISTSIEGVKQRNNLVTVQDKILIESRVQNDGPSIGAAYLLWLFLGIVSGHRFYLGHPGSAILRIMSYFVFVGFLWIIVDAFLIPSMIRSKQQAIRDRLTMEIAIYRITVDTQAPSWMDEACLLSTQPEKSARYRVQAR